MIVYLKLLGIVPVLVFGYQLYRYTVTLEKEERQRACRSLGIIIFAAGVTCLAFRNYIAVFAGLFMLMFGLRLIAYGLDRKNKKIFIDRYDEDDAGNP